MTQADTSSAPPGAEVEDFWAVIPAGGAGTRLWPLSRASAPKFLHDLTGAGSTLLQTTVDRLAPLAGPRVLVVTGAAHADAVRDQLPTVDPSGVVAEPSPRDSMAAIGLAAAMIERLDPDAVMGSFAADHVITRPDEFRDVVRAAVAAARDGWLVTIGIEPTHAATGFGYIRPGSQDLPGHPGVRPVEQFVEKPDSATAQEYVAAGYRWNAGMFVARPGVILDLLADGDPDFARTLREIAADPDTLAERWGELPRSRWTTRSPSRRPTPVASRWSRETSVGTTSGTSPPSTPCSSRATASLTVLGDGQRVQAVDATGLVVPGSDRVIAVVGLDDVVVVDTGDALLVTTTARAQDVKAIVAELGRRRAATT